jgi:hypothetical protein
MDDATSLLVAVTKFMMDVNQRLPPHWYSVLGSGIGSLSHLFGMSKDSFVQVLLIAGILHT